MRAATRRRTKSKQRSLMLNAFFGCGSGTMERASTRRCWARDVMDIGVCQECASAPSRLAQDSIFGASSERARKWSCAFRALLLTEKKEAPDEHRSGAHS